MLTAAPHPLKIARNLRYTPEGLTLAEMLELAQPDPVLARHAIAFIDGHVIPREIWVRVRPKAGTHVEIRVVPAGGGSSGGKNGLRIILTLVVIVASIYLGPEVGAAFFAEGSAAASVAGAVASAAISTAGLLLVNAIAPIRPPKVRGVDDEPAYSIQGSRNRLAPFEPVPSVLGRHRLAPNFGATPFTEIIGEQQYVRMLYIWGIGPLSIDTATLKIGETLLTEFEGVEIEHREGYAGDAALTLFPQAVVQENIAVKLTQAGGWISRTTADNADEIGIDITFPSGLYNVDKKHGGYDAEGVAVEIQYRKVGDATWLDPTYTAKTVPDSWVTGAQVLFRHSRQAAILHGFRWDVASRGQYEIQVRRTTEDDRLPGQIVDDTWWTALRAFSDEDPVQSAVPVAKTALRIKASEQLNGVVDDFNGVVTTLGKDWNGATWDDDQPITNPAALFRHVLQGKAIATPLADARLDLAGLQDWHDFNVGHQFTCNMVRGAQGSVWEVLADVAGAGRAAPTQVDGKWSVVIERPQAVPVSHITPRNSYDFSSEKVFLTPPHAWRVQFPNEDEGWRADERRVYSAGYDVSNATRFETLTLPGVTNADQIQRLGRFRIAQGALQPERWSFRQDMEFLTYQRGDRVALTHDVLLVGLKAGRIKAATVDGSNNVTALDVDEEITMEAGKSYGIAIRTVADAHVTRQVVTAAGTTKSLTLAISIPPVGGSPAVSAGDLFGFGLMGQETDDASIIAIIPEHGFQAQIIAVPYRASLFDVDSEAIPAFETNITPLASIPAPSIRNVISDESALALGPGESLRTRIAVWFDPLDEMRFRNPRAEIQARPSTTGEPFRAMPVEISSPGQMVIGGVHDGDIWDLRLRFVVDDRLPGPWATVNNHRVVGKSTPPDGLQGLTLSAFGGQAYLRWDAPSAIDVAYGGEVRFRHSALLAGASWAQSVSIGETARARDLIAALPLKPGTYLARVFDVVGNPSDTIATVTTKQASVLTYAAADSLDEDPGFAGGHTNTVATAGILKLDGLGSFDAIADLDAVADLDSEGGIASSGTYDFASGFDLGSVKRVRLTTRVTAISANVLDRVDDRSAAIDEWEDFDGTGDQAATDVRIEVRHTDDDPAGSPAWGDWQRLEAAEFEARGFDFRLQLTSSDPAYNIFVSDLGIDAEELA